MTYKASDTAVRNWDMADYDERDHQEFWESINALPLHSIVATGFLPDNGGLIYWEKTSTTDFEWTVVQVDDPNTEDMFPVGSTTEGDPACIDAGGNIEVAYVVREGS
jgi:hypothetical protein